MKMDIKARVHAGSSREEIKKIRDNNYEIWLKERAVDNKANLRLIKALKKHFGKDISIKSGFASKNKIIEIGG